ncbi:angiopoietin-related protein 7-like [Saccostrea cucullata]|uniref:angiopoietin-related protein 7-like n=1 Tax=Saccostrea cuccullata TaxID=36930 RepID=UPI002ED4934A
MTLANTRRLNDCPVLFDCYDIYNCGVRKTGIYRIYPYIKVNNLTSVLVMCDMESSGGGWTVIQHRNRDNPLVNFNTTWDEYKRGFGDIKGNYWLGNNAIHKLTTTYNNSLYIRMESTGKKSYEMQYSSFSISDETDGYRLSLGEKSGNIADNFRLGHPVVNHTFSTFDHDRNRCAAKCGSGWWYYHCTLSKEIKALESKDQELKEGDIRIQQELSNMNNRISEKQFDTFKKEDINSLRNDTFTLNQLFDTLSKEKNTVESKLHRMEKEIKSSNIEARLNVIENTFWNFSHSLGKALDDIREDQNATNIQLLKVSPIFQSEPGNQEM